MDIEIQEQADKFISEKKDALELFTEISDCTKQITDVVKNFKTKVEQGEFRTENGISLLDLKNQLMLQYLINMTHVMMLKTAGKSIDSDPTIDRLVVLRVIMERMRPLEQKLKYQIDKLIKVALTGTGNENDPTHFRANPANMMAKDDGDSSDGSEDENKDKEETGKERKKSGVYVPPKLAPVHYDGDESKADRKQRLLERAKRHALNSSVMRELTEEYLETPTEITLTNSAKMKVDKYERHRQEYEENYFTRLPVTKEDRKRAERLSTMGTLGDEITRFEDISALDGTLKERSAKKRKSKGKAHGGKKGKKRRRTF